MNRVAPRATAYLNVTFNSAGQGGPVNQRIYLTSNDPETRTLVLSVEGEVIADIAVSPRSIWLGEVKRGEKALGNFSIAINAPEKVKLKAVTVGDKRLKVVRKKESLGAANSYEYEIELTAGKKVEIIATEVAITVEGSDLPVLRMPVRAEVIGNLQYPKIIQFFNTGGHFSPVEMPITSRSSKPFKILKLEAPDKFLKLTIVEAKGPNAKIRAQIADPDPSHRPRTAPLYNFVVYTDDKLEPKITIVYAVSWNGPAPGQNIRRPNALTPKSP
jgi:hypothetical protein